MCTIRQKSCLENIQKTLQHILNSCIIDHDDMLSIELRSCIENCSELTGEAITEELLDGIFSRFCVGK